jgi:hypothetical protein
MQIKSLPSYYPTFWTHLLLFTKNPFHPHMVGDRTFLGEDISCGCHLKAFVGKFQTSFSSFLLSDYFYCAPYWACFPIASSWSSADVDCLKGGVNLITCGTVTVTRGALSLVNMPYTNHGLADAQLGWARDGTSCLWPKRVQSCKAVLRISASDSFQSSAGVQSLILPLSTMSVTAVLMWAFLSCF